MDMYRFYSRPKGDMNKSPRVTLVGEYDSKNQIVKIGVARCSRKDQFNRKLGRKIAEGRLKADRFNIVINKVKKPLTYKEFNEWAASLAEVIEKQPQYVHKRTIYTHETQSVEV